jgi:autotransporter passenger strand-loop-strand repeat protein
VLAGGSAASNLVDEFGYVAISSSGATSFDTILSGGAEYVSAGGSATQATVSSGGVLEGPGVVLSGDVFGLLSGATVSRTGLLNYSTDIESGGSASAVTVANHGELAVYAGGLANSTTVLAGGFFDLVASAQEAYAMVSGAGATMIVGSASSAYADFVSAGGVLSNLGVVESATIAAGGRLDNDAIVSGTQVDAGSVLSDGPGDDNDFIYSGPTDDSTVVSSGGQLLDAGYSEFADIQSGGVLSLTQLGTENDFTIGTFYGVSIESGGRLAIGDIQAPLVYAGGVNGDDDSTFASGSVLSFAAVDFQSSYADTGIVSTSDPLVGSSTFSDATLEIDAAIVESGVTLTLGGFAVVGSAMISSGGELFMASYGAGVSGATIAPDGVLVGSGTLFGYGADLEGGIIVYGVASSLDLGLSGTAVMTVESGGVADEIGALQATGSVIAVLSGGSSMSVTVVGYDTLTVGHGGSTSDAAVSGNGARAFIAGSASETMVFSGGVDLIERGGVAAGTTLSGGEETVEAGGSAISTTISSAGIEYVLAVGTATGTVVSAGGEQAISSFGSASGATVLSGGKQYVSLGGAAVSTTVSSGGTEYVLARGATTGTIVGVGGFQLVSSGGVASGTIVRGGARQYVSSGGYSSATTVSSGGAQTVLSTGVASGTVLSNGGQAVVSAGGLAESTVVSSGGGETIAAGGYVIGLSLLSGGVLALAGEARIDGAGALDGRLEGSGAIVEDAAGDLVMGGSGAAFSGKVAIKLGTIELASGGAIGTGDVEFADPATGSAALQIDAADAPAAGKTFANPIEDFSGAHEDIDLRSIAFVSGAKATLSGSTLVLTDGGKTYSFSLAGTIATTYAVTSDGHGGTMIDAAPGNVAVARFAQTAAAFAPFDAASTALEASTSPTARTPFLHAAASTRAGQT